MTDVDQESEVDARCRGSSAREGAPVPAFRPGLSTRPFGMGLDLTRPDSVTPDEREAYAHYYEDWLGRPHAGMTFWLDHDRPGALKRTRLLVEQIPVPTVAGGLYPESIVWLVLYALTGFVEGVRYVVFSAHRRGLTESQILEYVATAFLWIGPRGMDTVASALGGFEFTQPRQQVTFPDGWAADPDAFHCGLDFSTSTLSDAELTSLLTWYQTNVGEIPEYVDFLARWRPDLLKAYRNRFEHVLVELPKQVMPCAMILVNTLRGFADGVREGVLLARHWGVERDHVIQLMCALLEYGGAEQLSIVQRAVGELLVDWR